MSDSTTSPTTTFSTSLSPNATTSFFCGNMGVMLRLCLNTKQNTHKPTGHAVEHMNQLLQRWLKRFQGPHSQLICQHLLGMVSWIAAIPLRLTWQKIKVRPSIIGIAVEYMPGIMLCPMRFHWSQRICYSTFY